jgi:hypothetical protein
MRMCLGVVFSVLVLLPSNINSQQAATASTQPSTILAQSLAVLNGSVQVADVTLIGTVEWIAGSDDEMGTAVLQALATGASNSVLNFPSGNRTEIWSLSSAPSGSWSGPDGTAHKIVFHNLLSEPVWFFPAIAIARRVSNPSYVSTYVGQETHEGKNVQHISVYQTAPLPNAKGGVTFEHLTQVEIFLDSSTLLPTAIGFNIHPDDNALLDIPMEIQFADYRNVNGVQVPFRVQKLINGGVVLDCQIRGVTFNSGLSASLFTSQAQ